MKKSTVFAILAVLFTALSFTACNSTDNTPQQQPPTPQEAFAMLSQIAGRHQSGILFPGDNSNKIEKDSVECEFYVNANDSSYTITNFPVKHLAKYIRTTSIKEAMAALPNRTITGKLLAMPGSSSKDVLFGTVTNNISFKDKDGKDVVIAFYAGYNNYALAGFATNTLTQKKSFMMYLTMGAVYVNKELQQSALLSNYSTYGSVPYTAYLVYNL